MGVPVPGLQEPAHEDLGGGGGGEQLATSRRTRWTEGTAHMFLAEGGKYWRSVGGIVRVELDVVKL